MFRNGLAVERMTIRTAVDSGSLICNESAAIHCEAAGAYPHKVLVERLRHPAYVSVCEFVLYISQLMLNVCQLTLDIRQLLSDIL